MSEYKVEAKSRKDIRELSNKLREILNINDRLWIPIVELLDIFTLIFNNFNYEIVDDDILEKGIHADIDIRSGHIRIKESVYNGACSGSGRDRMTIAHEIGHYFTLCLCGFKLHRNFKNTKVPAYKDPEWQAKCFAGEFMIPRHLIHNMSPDEIVKACGVSLDAATVQYKVNERW